MADEQKAEGPEEDITSEGLDLLAEHAAGTPPLGHTPTVIPHGQREDAPALAAPEQEEERRPDESEPEETRPVPKLQRLQKILAQAGIASRRHAEELIKQGRVEVNGQVVTMLGSKADPERDHIRVDGKLLHGAERHRYFMLNKPRGFVTTASDPEGRPTVMQFFGKMRERMYPVGRLDFQSEGLLLVTNDGELANQLTRAASGVEKTYLVKVAGRPSDQLLNRLREGLSIDRGRPGEGKVRTAPARIRQVRAGENPWFEVALIEGRNRELRKIFEEIGHHVEKIRRVGYGPLLLDVEPGKFRELKPDEVAELRLAAEGKLRSKRINTNMMLPQDAGKKEAREEPPHRRRPVAGGPDEKERSDRRRQERVGARERDGAGPGRRPFRPEGNRQDRTGRGPQSRGQGRGFPSRDREREPGSREREDADRPRRQPFGPAGDRRDRFKRGPQGRGPRGQFLVRGVEGRGQGRESANRGNQGAQQRRDKGISSAGRTGKRTGHSFGAKRGIFAGPKREGGRSGGPNNGKPGKPPENGPRRKGGPHRRRDRG